MRPAINVGLSVSRVGGAALRRADRAEAVDRPAERIHDAAGHFFAHGHGHDLPRAAHAVALLQVTVGPEQDDADVLAAEVHDHAAQRAVKGQ